MYKNKKFGAIILHTFYIDNTEMLDFLYYKLLNKTWYIVTKKEGKTVGESTT